MTRELAMQMKEDAYELMETAFDDDDLVRLAQNYEYWSNQVRQFDTQLTLW
jgi:hypothetical protein